MYASAISKHCNAMIKSTFCNCAHTPCACLVVELSILYVAYLELEICIEM
jgi:hypothetical protein